MVCYEWHPRKWMVWWDMSEGCLRLMIVALEEKEEEFLTTMGADRTWTD